MSNYRSQINTYQQGRQPQTSSSSFSSEELPGRRRPSNSTQGASSGPIQVTGRQPVVFVIYYSMYGHIERMAMEVCAGVEAAGCECRMFQVAETLSSDVLNKMHAAEKNRQVPIIKVEQLAEADGIIFGMPTRFGSAPAQMRALFDQCGGHWRSNALIGKPAGVFFSTGSLGGGQETTALTAVTFFTHLGMIFVPLGYKNKSLQNLDEAHGGSPYGSGTLAGDGSRQPTRLELQLAQTQGNEFGKVVIKLTR
ncbi:unnamed protein product [Rotaria socialis]|uniref:Flavodoxin-like domain-containing protein n=2 Tax=Rotaria socialis TaxID=392032 RepID=A0A818Q6I9_9BILA|nr:unnamed protein product [Rotaria socialis]